MNTKAMIPIVFLLTISTAFALGVTFDNRNQIVPISTSNRTTVVNISGTVAGSNPDFTYAIYAPGRILWMSGSGAISNSRFFIEFNAPTLQQLINTGMANATNRAAVPLHILINFTDSNTTANRTMRTYPVVVVLKNTNFDKRIQTIVEQLQRTSDNAEKLAIKLENLSATAESAGRVRAATVLAERAQRAYNISAKADELKARLGGLDAGSYSPAELRTIIMQFREEMQNFKGRLGEIRTNINDVREVAERRRR